MHYFIINIAKRTIFFLRKIVISLPDRKIFISISIHVYSTIVPYNDFSIIKCIQIIMWTHK
ncbi:hypothetical protein A9196_15530 [Aeromonas dhakensis]|nr:hypothetical protein A9196_15530 [Aeromonas dhakensis]